MNLMTKIVRYKLRGLPLLNLKNTLKAMLIFILAIRIKSSKIKKSTRHKTNFKNKILFKTAFNN